VKITLVREDRIDPFWSVKITDSFEDSLAEALAAHGFGNADGLGVNNTDEISHAMETGHVVAAAQILMGATEAHALGAALDALEFNGHELPDFQAALDEFWASSDSAHVTCPKCRSNVFSDFEYGCGACGASLVIDVDAMVAAYVETALWSSHNELFDTSPCDKCGQRVKEFRNAYGIEWRDAINEMDADCAVGGAHEVSDPEDHSEMLDGDYSADDIEEGTLTEMRSDCESFAEGNILDLAGMDPGQAGHDFWLTRNGHGAGFWDRGLGEKGDRLSDAAHVWGEVNLYADADGAIHSQ